MDVMSKEGPYRLIVSLNLDRHAVLVIGGGAVAERKVRTLLRSGAGVRLVSPTSTEALAEMAARGEIIWDMRDAEQMDFKRENFAIIATAPDEAGGIAAMAREERCVVDVCSDGGEGDFALCAQFGADGSFVGVSSGGGDPAGAAAMKRKIMGFLGASHVVALTRNSPLALAQTGLWAGELERVGVAVASRSVSSHGDRDRTSELSSFGFGAFVKALEDELLACRGDFAVHSMKDMPTSLPDGVVIAGTLERGPVHDVLITRDGCDLSSMPRGAKVGTSSVRRRAQVRAARPDLECVTCRGNVGTRLEKLKKGEMDALILAEAGLERLGFGGVPRAPLPFITTAGQGAVAVETRTGSPLEGILRSLNHLPTWYEVTAERAFLARIGFGCVCPIGVNAKYGDGELELTVDLYPPDKDPSISPEMESLRGRVDSDESARALADRLWEMVRDRPATRAMTDMGIAREPGL
ncbi:MAG: hydroxymethylbilane synthase [Synergistaceae bacterium]|jgi:hydroxymethylbilane synthase|nr:hydroxymethylbilane synthase [Synergistaceae bacterium]